MKLKIFNNTIFIMYFFILATIFSCTLFEPVSPIASYIHIDTISIKTDYATQGSHSNKITDAWVLYDNKYLGTFPLPADIPLIGEGAHNITIRAGILENGILSTRTSYPKYTSFDTSVVLSVKEKTNFSPVVTYGSGVNFPQIEDFDDASLSLITTSSGTAPLVITPPSDPNSFEGNSGNVTLDENHPVFEVASSGAFLLPLNTPSFVELNYKGDNDFTIGVFVTTSNGIIKKYLLSVRASSTWKKIYVTLSALLGDAMSNGLDYKIYLHADKNPLLSSANIYFDNLKVVY